MEQFYSNIVPSMRDEKRFGKAGLSMNLGLCYDTDVGPQGRYSMVVIFHAVEGQSVENIRLAIEKLVARGILWQNPVDYWLEKFLCKLLQENWEYFCAASKDLFEQFRLSVFVSRLLKM